MTTGSSGRPLLVAGRPATLHVDRAAWEAIGPALAPHTDAPPDPTALDWRCWESAARHPLWTDDPTGPGRIDGDGLVVARPDPPVVEAFVPGRGLELWGAPGALGSGDVRAHPASTALAAWLAGTGVQVLHTGAVAIDGRAALLLGPSGAGKSTTTLACVAAGAAFVGDDLCAVEAGPEPVVHALYATAKLAADSDRVLAVDAWTTLGTTPRAKRVVAVPRAVVCRSAPVAALVVLAPAAASPAGPDPVAPAVATRALASTALKAGLGAGSLRSWLAAAAALARRVPAFAVTPAWDVERVAAAVIAALDRAAEAPT